MNSLAVIGPESSAAMKGPRDLLRCRHLVLADPASPLGKCSRDYLEREGIYQDLLPKTVLVDNSRGILAAIRTGRAEAGIAFASDAAQAAECRTRLAIDPTQAGIAYSAAICTGQREGDSQALLNFLTSPLGQRCFRRCGLTLPRKKTTSKKGTSDED